MRAEAACWPRKDRLLGLDTQATYGKKPYYAGIADASDLQRLRTAVLERIKTETRGENGKRRVNQARQKGVHLSPSEMTRVTGAETLASGMPLPVQVISNGEFNPLPQTERQRQVAGLINEYADKYGRKQGLNRRQYLRSPSGMAAGFLASNHVFGPIWTVSESEAADKAKAADRARNLSGQFIFDDQTHMVRDDFEKEGLLNLGRYAAEHWNPAMTDPEKGGVPMTLARYKMQNYLKEIFLDSDTKVALLSGVSYDDPSWWPLSNAQIAAVRDTVNKVAGARRMYGHFVFTPNYPGWMDEVERGIAELNPDAWKGYTVGDPFTPTAKGTQWRIDDEKLMYPFYERIMKTNIRNVCIHKGLMPADYERSWKDIWRYSTVWDLEKAARDWPGINFIIYHAAFRAFTEPPDAELAEFEDSGYIKWSTDLARLVTDKGLKNVYAEIGTAFANTTVTHPRLAAALIGQLVNMMGADRVVYGSDCVWYGSPQWQIEAMRRLEIPDDMMAKMKWRNRLGDADGSVKRKILGENAALLYGYPLKAAPEGLTSDHLAVMKAAYQKEGVERNNAYYGYVPKPTEPALPPSHATARNAATEDAETAELDRGFLALRARTAIEEVRPPGRGANAKGVCARAVFEVLDVAEGRDAALTKQLARGIYARPGLYPATIRFSNSDPSVHDDSSPDVRCLAFYVEVPPPSLPHASVKATRQDYSLHSAPTLAFNDVHSLVVFVKVFGANSQAVALGSLSFRDQLIYAQTMNEVMRQKRQPVQPYQQLRYWSAAPYRHGSEDIVKYDVVPAKANSALPLESRNPNALRDELIRHLNEDNTASSFDFRLQFLDPERMTYQGKRRDRTFWIENAAIEWPEAQAPFHTVARLTLLPRSALSAEACDAMHVDVAKNTLAESEPLAMLIAGGRTW